jgi:predicted nucleic-acid-binding protein
MIGLDTNVLVRYLVQDDTDQAEGAVAVMEGLSPERPGFVGPVVLVELHWVLRKAYGHPSDAVLTALEGLTRSDDLVVQERRQVRAAMRAAREGADALIGAAARQAGCAEIVTFDQGASRTWRSPIGRRGSRAPAG